VINLYQNVKASVFFTSRPLRATLEYRALVVCGKGELELGEMGRDVSAGL